MKVRGDEQSVTNSGRLFHARGPATAKARSPSDERRVAGTTRADDDVNSGILANRTPAINHNRVTNCKTETNKTK